MRFGPYIFEVVYRAGKDNCLADCLSRILVENDEPIQPLNSVPLFFTSKIELTNLQKEDPFAGPILKILRAPDHPSLEHDLCFIS